MSLRFRLFVQAERARMVTRLLGGVRLLEQMQQRACARFLLQHMLGGIFGLGSGYAAGQTQQPTHPTACPPHPAINPGHCPHLPRSFSVHLSSVRGTRGAGGICSEPMVRILSLLSTGLFSVLLLGGACTVQGEGQPPKADDQGSGGEGGDQGDGGRDATDDPSESTDSTGEGGTAAPSSGDGDESGDGDGDGTGGSEPLHVTIQLGQVKQTIAGFGMADSELLEEEADALFGQEQGQIALSILRIAMDSNGQPTRDDLTWVAVEQAKARGVQTFIATVTSPPGVCKSNAEVNNGGQLIQECFELWSNGIAAFPTLVKDETGVDLLAISPQNEPDFASCGDAEPCNGSFPSAVFTGGDYVAFLKVVAPKLKANDPPVAVIGGEPSQWGRLWSDASATG